MKKTLEEALAASPDNVPLLCLYANACEQDLEFDEMRGAWDRVLARAPSHPEARVGVSRALYLSGKLSEAALRLESWLEQSPGYAPAYVLAARIALAEQRRQAAIDWYEQGLALDGNVRDDALAAELYPAETPKGGRMAMTPQGPRSTDTEDPAEAHAGGLPELERPTKRFADVGGMEALKEEIRMKVLYPLENPRLFAAYGKKVGGGVLLYGPPGCGKTLISRATAGEIPAHFISVALHEVLDMWIGNSEKQLHALFETARSHKPAVLFFDEVDALAADRRDLRQSGGRTLIYQFLAEMDSSNDANEGLLILGATNAPWHIDSAFRRPGRFDRVLFVPPPDEAARSAILELLARDKPMDKFNPAEVARATRDFSGADLKALFDVATEEALTLAMKQGRLVPLTGRQLVAAAKRVKPTTRDWFASAKNHALYANQSGFYDDVLTYLGIQK